MKIEIDPGEDVKWPLHVKWPLPVLMLLHGLVENGSKQVRAMSMERI